jgi:hypothetical protein
VAHLSGEAQQHIQSLEDRITRQAARVVKLNYSREDATAEIRRLELMRKALIQMRAQLGLLCMREQDLTRADKSAALKVFFGKVKSDT